MKNKSRLASHFFMASLVLLAAYLTQAQIKPTATCINRQFDSLPWLEDLAQMTSEMAAHYANLEFAISERHMDLPKLRQETEMKLRGACDDGEARRILGSFLEAFGDGHLEIDWAQPGAPNAASKQAEEASLCARLGYKAFVKPGIDFSVMPGFTTLGGENSKWFPGGILQLTDRTELGVIRIALFSEHAFPAACEQTVHEMHIPDSAKCDEECANTIERETANHLTAAIVDRSAQLQSAGAAAMLVDITHNGGGSNWVEAPPRALSRAPLHESRMAFLRHQHWTKQLQDQLQDIETDLKTNAQPKGVLQEAAARLRSGIARSQTPCDRKRIWHEGKLDCSMLISDVLYNGGILPYAQPGSFTSLESKTTLFHPLRYRYQESANRLPLYVIVDRDTWSAAEYFAAILQDNSAATIVGEVSGGAGCGYTNGGIPTLLQHSHAIVKMPDCVRLRKDGTNEVSGIIPDVLVPWAAHDNSYLKAEKLLGALNGKMPASSTEARHEAH